MSQNDTPDERALTDAELDALDTFSLNWLAPQGYASVRAYGRAVIAALAARTQPLPPADEPTLDEVIDALNVFNPGEIIGPDYEREPWTENDDIGVKWLPKFIHSVGRAWYSGRAIGTTEAAPVLAQQSKELDHDRRSRPDVEVLQRDGTRQAGSGAIGVGESPLRVAQGGSEAGVRARAAPETAEPPALTDADARRIMRECALEIGYPAHHSLENLAFGPWMVKAMQRVALASTPPPEQASTPRAEPVPVETLLVWAVEDGLIRMSKIMDADLQDALVKFAARFTLSPSTAPEAAPKKAPTPAALGAEPTDADIDECWEWASDYQQGDPDGNLKRRDFARRVLGIARILATPPVAPAAQRDEPAAVVALRELVACEDIGAADYAYLERRRLAWEAARRVLEGEALPVLEARDAERYRWLRERPLDTLAKGGIFVGLTPDNVVVNGDDLDSLVDAAAAGAPG